MSTPPLVLRACTVDPATSTAVFADGRTEKLTPREWQLLAFLASRAPLVVSREELLEQVWQLPATSTSRVADTTIRRLREKVEADPQAPDHVLTAFGEGYRFVPSAVPEVVVPEVTDDDEPFVGRREELVRVCGWLATPGAPVVLVGPPGAGKTRLARRLALAHRRALPGGSWLVDVTECRDLPQVAHAVALGLGLESPQVAEATLQRVGHLLRGLGPVLLVLDNCEGAPAAVGQVAARLRAAAPEARLLATSRERIAHQDDDRTLAVEPLPLDDAVELFEVLAERVRPDFVVGPELRPVVEELVERLERIPLAIALAAGRAGALSPRALLERLDDRFRLLQSRDRDSNPRQRTLRAALDWSWELLGPAERDTLAATSAFRGGFDLAAAERVVDRPDTAAQLAALCARSLLEVRNDRFGGYAFVREYASARLAEDPEREVAVFVRHGRCYADRVDGTTTHDRGRRLSRDRANLAEATRRALADGRVVVAARCCLGALDVIGREGPYELGLELVRGVLAAPDVPADERALLGLRLSVLELATGAGDGVGAVERALEDAERADDDRLRSEALRSLANLRRHRGDNAGALVLLDRAEAVCSPGTSLHVWINVVTSKANVLRELGRVDEAYALWVEVERRTTDDRSGDSNQRVYVLGNLAQIERRRGQLAEAERHLQEAVAIAVDLGDRRSESIGRMGLGNLLLDAGRLEEAREQYLRGLRLAREIGEVDSIARFHGNLALVERSLGRLAEAEEHLRVALSEFERTADQRHAVVARGNLAEVMVLQGRVEEAIPLLSDSVAWMRRSGEAYGEAELCASLAVALLRVGRLAEARAAVERGISLASSVGNRLVLARNLARRGLIELAERRDAGATLAEVDALGLEVGPASDTGAAIRELREALHGRSP